MATGKRKATEEEVEQAIARQQQQFPDHDYAASQAKAHQEGREDEVCLTCGLVCPACCHWIRCVEDDCPMKSKEDFRSLAEVMLGVENPNKALQDEKPEDRSTVDEV